jgi:hypothetical protein
MTAAARAQPKLAASDKPKNGARQQQQPQNQNQKLKVVIRGLPPNLPESNFKDATAAWINEGTVDWYYYVTGKLQERYILEPDL